MLECLVGLIVAVIIGLIVLWVIETVLKPFFTLPANILMLIRLLIGLLVLIYALQCIGVLGGGHLSLFRLRD